MMPTTLNTTTPALGSAARRIAAILLLIFGVQLWLVYGRGLYGNRIQYMGLLVALGLALIPPVARVVCGWMDRVRSLSPAVRRIIFFSLWAGSCLLLYHEAVELQRSFQPKMQDEFSYLIQTQMAARGRLWMPQHPLADFFDSFQLVVSPVYASMYFPGQAILYAPFVWLKLPMWLAALAASGACVAMVYRVAAGFLDDICGLLAAMLMVGTYKFRHLSIQQLAQIPSLLLGLLMLWAYLRWRKHRSGRWALVIGILAGWAGITRPLDGLVYAIPIGLSMMVDIFSSTDARRSKSLLRAGLSLFLGALPFLCIQAMFNRAVTGSIFQTPFSFYAQRDYPQTTYGFHDFDPTRRPISTLPQKQAMYDVWSPLIQGHAPANWWPRLRGEMLPTTLSLHLPQEMLLILLPAGLLGLRDNRRWAPALITPIFLLLYSFYVFFLAHYPVASMAGTILLLLCALPGLASAWPGARAFVWTFGAAFVLVISITRLPSVNRFIHDEFFKPAELETIAESLSVIRDAPAVVLFRYDLQKSYPETEPVYNVETAWPDDARIIRAHDLGERNIELFKYYARHQPDRVAYLYDRGDGSLKRLGNVKELAAKPDP